MNTAALPQPSLRMAKAACRPKVQLPLIQRNASMDTDQNAEIVRHRREWQPWLYRFLMAPALIGCLAIVGVANVYYFEGSCLYFDCIDLVPYWKAPIPLAALAILVKFVERPWHKLRAPVTSS